MRSALIMLIRSYQYLISPLYASTCRFTPSCSHYFIDAVSKYGVIKGCWLSSKRLLRCNPWNSGGYDPVP